jgi:uncharacterized protein YktB (UPF0637 family)
MQVSIIIPSDIQVYFEQIVKDVFKGNTEAALLEAVARLIEKERKEMVDDAVFDMAIDKMRDRRIRKEEIADKEMGDAFRKLQDKKKRASAFFDQITRQQKNED